MTLETLVLAPPHSLLHQSYRPKFQRHGTVNADGFGCGWFAPEERKEPAVYRRDKPIWSDRTFASISGVIKTGAFLAAVRDATTGSAAEESSTAPFSDSVWLFSHNGLFREFGGPPGLKLRRLVSEARIAAVRGTSDSEVLFALVLDRLDEGLDPARALASSVDKCLELSTGAFNFLLMDAGRIYGTVCGDSMFVLEDGRRTPGAVVLASEPFDDDPAWRQVPESSVVEVSAGLVDIRPLGSA